MFTKAASAAASARTCLNWCFRGKTQPLKNSGTTARPQNCLDFWQSTIHWRHMFLKTTILLCLTSTFWAQTSRDKQLRDIRHLSSLPQACKKQKIWKICGLVNPSLNKSQRLFCFQRCKLREEASQASRLPTSQTSSRLQFRRSKASHGIIKENYRILDFRSSKLTQSRCRTQKRTFKDK